MTKEFIYSLIDPRTNEVKYIGRSKDPKNRLFTHINESRTRSSSKDLWIKELMQEGYVPELFVVDFFYTELDKWEIFYIHLFKTWGFNLLNIVTDIQNRSPYKLGGAGTSIIVLDKNNNYITKYESIKKCAVELNLNYKRIQEILAGTRSTGYGIHKTCKSNNGYVFVYESEYDANKDYSVIKPLNNKGKIDRVVEQYDLRGNLTNTFISAVQAGKANNVGSTEISRMCGGTSKCKTVAGYTWKYRFV